MELVQRLRQADETSMQRVAGSRIFKEAADEIERLRALLLSCQKAMEHSNSNGGLTDWRHMISAIGAALEQNVDSPTRRD